MLGYKLSPLVPEVLAMLGPGAVQRAILKLTLLEASRAWWIEATALVPRRGPLPRKGYRLPLEAGKLLSGLHCLAASLPHLQCCGAKQSLFCGDLGRM